MSETSQWQALLSIADTLEPELAERFIAAIEEVRVTMSFDDLVSALEHGGVVPDSVVNLTPLSAELKASVDLIVTAVHQAGSLAATHLSLEIGHALHFDITNPIAITFATNSAATMVTNVVAETQAAIRDIIVRSFTEGLTVEKTARLLKATIGQTRQAAQAIANYRQALIDQGLNPSRVDKLVARYADKKLRERARAIARTEIMGASNGGQDELWRQAVAKGFLPPDVETKWVVTDNDRLCKRCRSMDGQTRKLGEAFVCPLDGTTVLFPPLHTNCRCVRVIVIKGG